MSERKTIRETIKEGIENDIVKHKYLAGETADSHIQKIDIKYSKEAIQNQFAEEDRRKQQGEEVRIAKYLDVAFADVQSLLKGIIGGSYQPKNNFSLNQKQKVLSYLYFKNKADMDSPLKQQAAYGGIEMQDAEIYYLENRLQGIQKLKFDNRAVYINQIAQCQNRIRYNGFLWGFFASSVLWGTLMRKQSIIRKVCLTLTLTHIGGQVSSLRSIDRIFDSVYPIFEKDYDNFFITEEERKREHLETGGIKSDEIRNMIEENMKLIRKGKKIAQQNQNEDGTISN